MLVSCKANYGPEHNLQIMVQRCFQIDFYWILGVCLSTEQPDLSTEFQAELSLTALTLPLAHTLCTGMLGSVSD